MMCVRRSISASIGAISFAGSRDDQQRLERIERFIGKRLPQTTIEGLEPTRPMVLDGKKKVYNRNDRNNYGKTPDYSRRQEGTAKRSSYGNRRSSAA
jgi:superfamily II DNA/RNA helicase